MRKPIYTDAEIIKVGKNLTSELGREVTATDIHQAVDCKGKYARVRIIWEAYKNSREEEPEAEIPLPEGCQDRIAQATVSLQSSIEALMRDIIVRMTEQNVRQSALRERDFAQIEADHAKHVRMLEEEIAYLIECLDEFVSQAEREDEATTSENANHKTARYSSTAPTSAAGPLAPARKPSNRPVKKIPPVPRKGLSASAASPKKSPR